jgi:hypothetical protein
MKRILATLLRAAALLLSLHASAQPAPQAWPVVVLPEGVQRFDIGEQINANGMPLRMQGFVSPRAPAELADWFRARLGKPLMENTVAGKLVLGHPEGEFYLTVQLEQLANGTRGLVAVSHLLAGYERFPAMREATQRLLARLPAGSRVLGQTTSTEAGRLSRYVVIQNGHGIDLNRSRVIALMREDGLALQREAKPGAATARSRAGHTLFFQGGRRDAMAVLSSNADGSSTLLLHTLNTMEHFQ